MEILQELNEKQGEAVTHKDGAILVVAGPGTGKTMVITHRIAHLIHQHGVPPEQILAVTFTNKAAQEMLDRIKDLLGTTQGLDVRIHTFHAFCVGLLREHAPEIGLSKNFTIFDQETQEEILIECLRELKLNRLDYPPWQLRDIIGAYKVRLEDPLASGGEMPEIRTRDGDVIDDPSAIQNIADLIKAYQSNLAAHSALDFDDLLYRTVEVLQKTPAVRAKYHRDIRYILVDEYQDINAAQYELLRLLCRVPGRNLMVVADENQSIYSWRGSMPEYIERFRTDFQPTVVELEEHYRCTEKILRAAQTVISKNTRLETSTLKTHRGAGHTLFHYTLSDPNTEASHVVKLIRQLVNDRHYSYGDIAVFYRTHRLAEALADRLYYEGIQFQRIGRENSFQETHAQDISSYLSFVQWHLPRDLERALNFPQSLIDDLTFARLKWLARRDKLTLVELLKEIENYPDDVGPLTRRNIRQFLEDIDGFADEIKGEKIGRAVSKLFNLLESRRSPYRDEEIRTIEEWDEIRHLRMAADALYSAVQRGESVRITATTQIDARCAAHIVHQTIERYLDCGVHIEFLPSGDDTLQIDQDSITILIGRFAVVPETTATVILIASEPDGDANAIQLGRDKEPGDNSEIAKSVIALKLCQRVVGYFETPNYSDMIVYDLETTDYNPKRAEIVEIAAKRLSIIGSEIERYHQLVKPSRAIPASSTRVHGIDNETVKDAPSIEAVLPGFLSFIQDRILIGHNVIEFDNMVLERDLRRLDVGLSNPCYDTLVTAQRLYPRESRNLEALSEKFGIEHDTMHRAIEDVEVNHRVFEELVKVNLRHREVRSLMEFLPLVGIGILANQAERRETEVSESALNDERPSAAIGAYLQASARYVQYHRPETDKLMSSMGLTEAEDIGGYLQTLRKTTPADFPEDGEWENRRARFMNGMLHFERNSREKDISGFLDYQKLINSADETEIESDKITLMTLHAAKGTEFRVVIITGMEEGTFPIRRKDQPLSELEEERRLFYVGMTRAKERLYLTSVVRRRGDLERAPSMFTREIPSNLINRWSPRRSRR